MQDRKNLLQAVVVGALLLTTCALLANVCWVLASGGSASDVNDFRLQVLAELLAATGALVTVELGLTKVGRLPGERYGREANQPDLRRYMVWAASLLWLLGGLALLGCCLYRDTVLPKATAIAQSWLGIAVAALYAYFGLPKSEAPGPPPAAP